MNKICFVNSFPRTFLEITYLQPLDLETPDLTYQIRVPWLQLAAPILLDEELRQNIELISIFEQLSQPF